MLILYFLDSPDPKTRKSAKDGIENLHDYQNSPYIVRWGTKKSCCYCRICWAESRRCFSVLFSFQNSDKMLLEGYKFDTIFGFSLR